MISRPSRKQRVAIVGATGMVGRRLASLLQNHPEFELQYVIGTDARVGEHYGTVWESKEKALVGHYGQFWREFSCPEPLRHMRLSSFQDLLRSECQIVFSSIHERSGHLEDELLAQGRWVFSNSPYRRFDEGVSLVVPEVNGKVLAKGRLIKTPNCVS